MVRARPRQPGPSASVAAKAWSRALELTAPIVRRPDRILPTVIEELAETFGDAPALLSDGECLTYRALAERSNRYARWAIEQGLAKGDVVCLLMPNRPEYMAIWLGITRVGGVVALLNTNLAGPALAHCINIVAPKHLIVAAELVDRLTAVRPDLAGAPTIWVHGAGHDQFPRIDSRNRAIRAATRWREAERRRRHHRRSRALHLHLRHDRAAQGRQREPCAGHAVEPLVRRADGRSLERPDVQLPADVSQRRRRARDRRGPGGRRLGGDPRTILGAPVLERRRPLGLHAVPVHRRAVPVPAAHRAASARDGSPDPDVLRQRAAGPTSGTRSRSGFASRTSWSSTPRPKATSRSSTSKASPAPSAASRRFWRTGFRRRS